MSPGQQMASGIVQTGASAAGAGLATAGIIGGTGSTAAALAAVAIPVIGIVAAVVALGLKFLGKGCGSACVTTAKIHQTFSLTQISIYNAAAEGYISGAEGAAAIQGLMQTLPQAEAATGIHIPDVQNGIEQFNTSCQGTLGLLEEMGDATKAWDWTAVRQLYCGHGYDTPGNASTPACGTSCGGAHGLYCDSVSASDSLSDQTFQAILNARATAPAPAPAPSATAPSAPSTSPSALISSAETEAQSAGLITSAGGVSTLGWIIIAGLGVVAIFAFSGGKS